MSSSSANRRGVHPTPPPLVSWIVRAVHQLLQDRFRCSGGLADPAVRLLDPAAGPLNFILAAWQLALDEHDLSREGDAAELLSAHLLPHSHGIEILPEACQLGRQALREFIAPYLVSEGAGRHLLVCGDALAGPAAGERIAGGLPVILSNPPWIGFTPHRGAWISSLLRGYRLPDGREDPGCYQVDGLPLGEKNSKWLQDDCIKFLRLAQWIIDRHGEGIAAFVINHNALDAPTLRGFRFSLLQAFEEIWALDLHGNRRKDPGDKTDQNLFPGVRQGAAVLLLLKRPGLPRRVVRADLTGSRAAKLDALAGDLGSLDWQEIRPRGPLFLLAPSAERRIEREYLRGTPIPQIFPHHSSGVITGDDALLTHVDRRTLEQRLLDTGRPEWIPHLTVFLARPFDLRYILFLPGVLARARLAVMRHLRLPNIALVLPRLQKAGAGALVTSWITGHKAASHYDTNFLFPLFLYSSREGEPHPNIAAPVLRSLSDLYGRAPAPEEILSYVYAVLQAPLYRRRYAALLAHGFPRIPFPRSLGVFEELASRGRELIRLHLLLDGCPSRSTLHLTGDPTLPLAKSSYAGGTIVLNPRGLCLDGISPEIWEFRVGGYPVLSCWLRARRGQVLERRDRHDLDTLIRALGLTLRGQDALDPLVGDAAEDVADRAAD